MIELKLSSKKRNEMIDITSDIVKIVKKEKIENGFLIIFIPHTTAGIIINEGADKNVKHDIIEKLKEIFPMNNNYLHLEGNSDAHIKTSLFGSSEIILIEKNNLILGTWQHIFFYEGDGPRNRRILVKIISDL
jgi:secondary thiamine-phosphate synthase enzyme